MRIDNPTRWLVQVWLPNNKITKSPLKDCILCKACIDLICDKVKTIFVSVIRDGKVTVLYNRLYAVSRNGPPSDDGSGEFEDSAIGAESCKWFGTSRSNPDNKSARLSATLETDGIAFFWIVRSVGVMWIVTLSLPVLPALFLQFFSFTKRFDHVRNRPLIWEKGVESSTTDTASANVTSYTA